MNESKKYFFIGIGGVGMSAIAIVLNKRGHRIIGSDRTQSINTKLLAQQGMEIKVGHNADNITPDLDAVVYTNAISEDNPEFVKAKELGIPVIERAVMLNEIALSKFAIGVSGTHGKTSTTSMVSKIFLKAGLDPSLAVGGYLKEINGSGYEGNGKYFIYEACEAFGSIGHLKPDIALITNIDKDHLDYYKTLANIKKMFKKYICENVPPFGLVIYNRDDKNLRELVDECKLENAISIGIRHKSADFTVTDVAMDAFSSSFSIIRRGSFVGRFTLNVPGMHNIYNASLAIAAAHLNGIPNEYIALALGEFKNADRRFQLKLEMDNLTVIDDYAHHPSEIRATLNAARKLSSKRKAQLIAIFQPHLYSRTEHFYKDFAKTLAKADRVVLTDIYAAREKNIHNISSQIIYDEVVKIKGAENVIYSHNLDDVPVMIKPLLAENSVLVTLGAGDVWKVSEMFSAVR
jgi:UDP-N-acetylmuramate--alanine ligase